MSDRPNPPHGQGPAANRYQETLPPQQAGPHRATQAGPAGPGAPPRMPVLPVKVGSFVLQKLLGRGGMSLTFLGHRDGQPDEKVVVKLPLNDDEVTLRRF